MKKILAFTLLLPQMVFAIERSVNLEKSKILWTGKKPTGEHTGELLLKKGTVTIENDLPKSGLFTLDMQKINNYDVKDPTYKTKLETHLKSADFFDVEKYPEGAFQITKVTPGKKKNELEITGMLKLKDVEKEITFPGIFKKTGDKYEFKGKTKFDRTLWNVKYNSKKFFDVKVLKDKVIHDEIEVELNIET